MRSRRRTDRGAAAVETALVLPILLLLVFGIVDFGRMLNAQITVTEAAREGARAATLDANPVDRVEAVTSGSGTITDHQECPSNPSADDDAEVTVSHTFSFITPVGALAGVFAGGGFGEDVELSGIGVMPCRA